jgi:hypothetical protein
MTLGTSEIKKWAYSSQVNNVWIGLQHRITSRGGDEQLCIAILLGLDIEELQIEPDAGKEILEIT